MLTNIRELATGWIAGIIVTLLVLSFALWGVGSYFSEATEPFVAKVNDTEIKQSQYQRAYYNLHQQMQKKFGTQLDSEDPMIKQQTVNHLVDSELINQAITGAGLRVSDEKVINTINQIDLFQNESGFDQNVYQRSINSLGIAPTLYEQQVRLDMLSEQLQSSISESSFTTEKEIENIVRLKKQHRDFSYVLVSVKKLSDTTEANDEEIKAYYESHQSDFRQPQQIKIQYLDLTLDKVIEQVSVSLDDMENYYINNQLAYNDPEKRKLWQIKLGKPEKATEEQLEEVRAKADELRNVAASGETFEAIAEKYSSVADGKVKVDVSESGFIAKGSLSGEVDEVLFGLNKGELSDLIETDKAIQIIQLKDIQEVREKNFSEVKDQVEKDLRRELAQKQFFDLADQLATLSYEQPDTLEVAGDAIDISMEESALFNREGMDQGLLSYTRVIDASFSDEVLLQGNNSDALELSDERVVVLRVIENVDEGQKSLSEVRGEVTVRVINEKSRSKANEIGQSLLKKAKEHSDLEALLSEHGLELKQASELTRDDLSVNRSILRTAFRMEKPAAGETKVDGSQIGNGDYAMVILQDVAYPEKIMGKDIKDQAKVMQRLRAESDWDGFFEQIKSTADIRIISDNL